MEKECIKCGSNKIIPNAKVLDRGHLNVPSDLTVSVDQNPNALIFKDRIYSGVFAKICGECGFLEFYAKDPKALYEAHDYKSPF